MRVYLNPTQKSTNGCTSLGAEFNLLTIKGGGDTTEL